MNEPLLSKKILISSSCSTTQQARSAGPSTARPNEAGTSAFAPRPFHQASSSHSPLSRQSHRISPRLPCLSAHGPTYPRPWVQIPHRHHPRTGPASPACTRTHRPHQPPQSNLPRRHLLSAQSWKKSQRTADANARHRNSRKSRSLFSRRIRPKLFTPRPTLSWPVP